MHLSLTRETCSCSGFAGSKFNNGGPSGVKRTPEIRQIEGKGNLQWKASGVDKNKKPATLTERMEEKPSSSETMPIEGATSFSLIATYVLYLLYATS